MEDNKVIQTGMIMDGISQTSVQKQSKENLDNAVNEAIGTEKNQIIEAMARYKVAHTPKIKEHKVGRNDSCPCGSGKKYKNCCLSSGKYENYIMKK